MALSVSGEYYWVTGKLYLVIDILLFFCILIKQEDDKLEGLFHIHMRISFLFLPAKDLRRFYL